MSHPVEPGGLRRVGRCLLACGALAGLWGGVLPWLASQPRIAEHMQWLDEQGIDAGAMYYTELDAMQPILQRLHRGRWWPARLSGEEESSTGDQ